METSEATEVKLEATIKMLSLSCRGVDKVISRNKVRDLEKTLRTLEEQKEEAESLKIRVQTLMFNENMEEEEVSLYGEVIDSRLEAFNDKMEELQAVLDVLKEEEVMRARRKFEEQEQARIQLRYEEEKKIEEMRLQVKSMYETNSTNASVNRDQSDVKPKEPRVKLPKLVITKFQGHHLDWIRFWSQFEIEIDNSDLSPVSKFSYLKELLIRKVRLSVDGLPFTAEGYNRAKNILKSKYGKPSEVANAHIQGIIALPTINQPIVLRIHDFYEKLATNVQSLDTMGKLDEIKGYVRLTLDKVPCIRADLVRTDDDWQEWDFRDLIEALRKWTDRNPISTNNIDQKLQYNLQDNHPGYRREKLLQTSQMDVRNCIFCDKNDHKATQCKNVVSIEKRRQHRASGCKSK